MLSTLQIAAIGGVLLVVLVAVGVGIWYYRRDGDSGEISELPEGAEPVDDVDVPDDHPQPVKLPRPKMSRSGLGLIGQLWKTRKHYKKEEKLHDQGYVKWYLIRDVWPDPIYVKPVEEKEGVPRVYHDGKPYAFPKEGMVPDERQGIWTAIHKAGEADPINVREPADTAISAQQWHNIISMSLESSPPSFWDRLNISGTDAIKYSIGATILIAVVWSIVQGGGV